MVKSKRVDLKELERKEREAIMKDGYDSYTFGKGPDNGCDHRNASCSFNTGNNCHCPNCGASW